MSKHYRRNSENSIHEDIILYKEYLNNREKQKNMFSLLTKKTLFLTNQPYKKIETKIIKNGRNIIKNVPCDSEGNIDTETIAILEWIYKEMYIKNKKQVDFNQMKKSYEKEQKKLSLNKEGSSKLFIL